MKKKTAVYPGTFDPITWGHLDVIEAASAIFDEVVVGLLTNPRKKPMFSEEERLAMTEGAIVGSVGKARAKIFKGLTVDFAREEGAIAIVRGLRLVMDYEAELDISFNSRVLDGGLYTVFIAPKQEHIHIRSSTVRELLAFDATGKLRQYVPDIVIHHIEGLEAKGQSSDASS